MMKHRILLASAVMLVAAPAGAETLRDALVRAYATNPTITGQRANLRATDETVPLARADGLPSAAVDARYSEDFQQAANQFFAPARSVTGQANLSIPLYAGGSVRNSVRAARTRVEAGRANLRGTEAQLFTDVVAAYLNVIRDEAIVELNAQNVRALEINLQATRDRFEVGDVTRTDVAQSEARLAAAVGQLRGSEATLIASREFYIRTVGVAPEGLQQPPPLPGLPDTPDAAVAAALESNPTLIAARRNSDAAGFDARAAQGQRLPQVSTFLGGNYFNNLASQNAGAGRVTVNSGTAASAGVQMRIPIYQGGAPAANVRRARALESVAIEQVTATERGVIEQARAFFANWQSSLRVIEAAETQVAANRLSLEGVRAENSVGTRTILDILDAERELLNSQVTLVTARRDAYVAGFALLAAMGRAEARDLGLDGGPLYDPDINYRRVRGAIWDWSDGKRPAPVASSTANTPAQTPVVTTPLDPELQRGVDTGPANPDR